MTWVIVLCNVWMKRMHTHNSTCVVIHTKQTGIHTHLTICMTTYTLISPCRLHLIGNFMLTSLIHHLIESSTTCDTHWQRNGMQSWNHSCQIVHTLFPLDLRTFWALVLYRSNSSLNWDSSSWYSYTSGALSRKWSKRQVPTFNTVNTFFDGWLDKNVEYSVRDSSPNSERADSRSLSFCAAIPSNAYTGEDSKK